MKKQLTAVGLFLGLLLQVNIALALDVAPILSIATAVPNPTFDTTPLFSFNSNEAGIITYVGDCTSTTQNAVPGANPVYFDKLSIGWHTNCEIRVTDLDGVANTTALPVPAFEVKLFTPPFDKTDITDIFPPTLEIITEIDTPTMDTTPSFTFS